MTVLNKTSSSPFRERKYNLSIMLRLLLCPAEKASDVLMSSSMVEVVTFVGMWVEKGVGLGKG